MGDHKTIALLLMLFIIGFKGTRAVVVCSAEIPCMNAGTCENNVCTCASGYYGATCADTSLVCSADVPCMNTGTCENNVCTCASGYYGATCADTSLVCSADVPCMNTGTCENNVCTCASGYYGATCADTIDCASGNLCLNLGTCVTGTNTCTCADGFTGSVCDRDIDECASGPCLANEDCTDGVNMYTCACSAGYTGTPCAVICTMISDCQTGEICSSGTCACPDGYSGSSCDQDIDECASGPCMANKDCTNGVNMYTCACSAGYTGTPCAATTPATGTLQCYSCSTNSISDVCSTADELASADGVLTSTCNEGQRCWTDHYENSSHTIVSRGCTDEECSDLHEGGGPYCTMANGATRCTSCCTESKCNDNKSSSEGLTSSCVTWLTSLFSVVIMLITYRI